MLILARLSLKRDTGEEGRRQGRESFQDMVRATRIMPRLQLSAEDLARVSTRRWTEETPPDLIFYTGCNILRTPHIALLCLDVLDKLGLSYAVYGGHLTAVASCSSALVTPTMPVDRPSRQ